MNAQHTYSCNMQALKEVNEPLALRLEEMAYDLNPYRHGSSRTGKPVLEVVKDNAATALCSKVDPLREAQRLVRTQLNGTEQLVVLFGLGLAYHLEEMLSSYNEAHFVVIEPDMKLFSEILKSRDISGLLRSERVTLLLEPESIDLDALSPYPPTVHMAQIVLRPYRILYALPAARAEKDFLAYVNSKKINRATLKRFDRLWTKNTFKNCHYFFTHSGVSLLENRFRGIAAIVVAAGPSVEQDLALLKRHSSGCIIIAVDTVLNTLLNRGLKPDIVVTVDPQLINSFHLSSLSAPLEAEQLPILVADPAVYPTALRSYRGDILITSSVFNPGRIIEQFSERKGTIAAGGSVATAAFDLARLMGTDPVILMGLDLSFSGLKTHISGSYVERYVHNNAYRLKPITTYTASYIRGGNPALFHNKAGVPVLSDSRMELYKNWFERQMVHQKTTVLNASRRGLAIEGIPDIAPESIPTHVPNGVDKEKILEDVRILIQSSEIQFEKAALFMEYLALRHGDLERVESLAHRAAETAESLKDKPSPEKVKTLSSLETQIVSFADCSRLIDMVMQEPINETLSQKAAGDMKLLLSRSIALYRAIEEASIFLQELLAETMGRLKLKQQLHPPSHDAI